MDDSRAMPDLPANRPSHLRITVGGRPLSRAQKVLLVVFLVPVAFVLAPLILFVAVCALVVGK